MDDRYERIERILKKEGHRSIANIVRNLFEIDLSDYPAAAALASKALHKFALSSSPSFTHHRSFHWAKYRRDDSA